MRRAFLLAVSLALLVIPAAGSAGITFSYSITSGTPGDNGWYLSAVTVAITVTGATDTTCPSVKTFRANSDPPLDCTATDGGPPVRWSGLDFNIDTDAPAVTGSTPSRAADANGWFNQPVSLSFTGSDATSGIASCSSSTYNGPDSGSASVSGTCRDKAGNVGASAASMKYDATPPTLSPAADRGADGGGWYNHAVAVTFAGSDATAGIDSCTGNLTYSGPDTSGSSVAGSCVDRAGNRTSGSLSLKYDATAPAASATLARAPDRRDWYTRPVAISFTGSDALSGLADCTAAKTYGGPDGGAVRVEGACHDNAGNTSATAAPLKYDATEPRLQNVAVVPGSNDVTVTWKQPADVASVAVTRTPGRKGTAPTEIYKGKAPRLHDSGLKPGVTYRYRLTSIDAAGNDSVAQVSATLRALYAPAPGRPAHPGTALRWNPEKKATYYNLQLYHRGKKVLSTWPLVTSFHLPRTWSYSGHKYRLAHGTYRWFVWPGLGTRARAHYGPLLGSSSFVVR